MNWLPPLPPVRPRSPDLVETVLRVFQPYVLTAILVLTLGLLPACSFVTGSGSAPGWFLSPPPDTASEWWGAGEGPDYDSAVRAALRQVAGRLRVRISSSTSSLVQTEQQNVYRSDQTQTRESIDEIEFAGVQVKSAMPHRNGVYALVRVDRQLFVSDIRTRYDTLRSAIRQSLQTAEQAGAFEQFRALRLAMPHAEKAVNLALLLRVADPAFRDDGVQRLSSIPAQAREMAGRVEVRVAAPPESSDIATVLSQALLAEGFSVSPSSVANTVYLIVSERNEQLFDAWNCRLDIKLNWVGQGGAVLISRILQARAVATDSPQRAREQAVRRLAQSVADGAILGVLGL